MAAVYQLSDGKRSLRLTEFETSNGADVHVYLVAAPDMTDNNTVKQAGFVDLGSIKGNIGDPNYDLPTTVEQVSFCECRVRELRRQLAPAYIPKARRSRRPLRTGGHQK